ncbi:MAG TPA: phosphatidate cytidylyltransferase [Candidatus Polarisedimenticolaceae bacterium]|nr:phosphatidate cytidylyltransferase [Candidatus Polarisedimenticolaceae bacterium]
MTRLLTAAILIPITWWTCKRAPFPVFLAIAMTTIGIAAWECYGLLRARGSRPFVTVGVALSLLVVWGFSGLSPRVAPIDAIAAAVVAVPILAMWGREAPEGMLDALWSTLLPVVFVGFTLGHSVALRAVPGELGSDLLVLLLVCVTFSDTTAYYVGSAFGRRRLAPSISPKKSWEGLLGGLLGAVLGALLGTFWFFQALKPAHAVAVGILVSLCGVVGDLAESMVKRAAGRKDSSALLPGHGGMLDRVDGLLVAAPVLYYYWRIILSGAIA